VGPFVIPDWRRWLRRVALAALLYGAGMYTYWILAGGSTQQPDQLSIAGFLVSVLAAVLAWRIYEMQQSTQSSFEQSQGKALGDLKDLLARIDERARVTEDSVESRLQPVIEALVSDGQETRAKLDNAVDQLTSRLDEVSRGPADNGALEAALANLRKDVLSLKETGSEPAADPAGRTASDVARELIERTRTEPPSTDTPGLPAGWSYEGQLARRSQGLNRYGFRDRRSKMGQAISAESLQDAVAELWRRIEADERGSTNA
jgi:hypothetical protein